MRLQSLVFAKEVEVNILEMQLHASRMEAEGMESENTVDTATHTAAGPAQASGREGKHLATGKTKGRSPSLQPSLSPWASDGGNKRSLTTHVIGTPEVHVLELKDKNVLANCKVERLSEECNALKKHVNSLKGEVKIRLEMEKKLADAQRQLLQAKKARDNSQKKMNEVGDERNELMEALHLRHRTDQQRTNDVSPTIPDSLLEDIRDKHNTEIEAAFSQISRLQTQLRNVSSLIRSTLLPLIRRFRTTLSTTKSAALSLLTAISSSKILEEIMTPFKQIIRDTNTPLGVMTTLLDRMAWYEWREAVRREECDEARVSARVDHNAWMKPRVIQDFLNGGSLWLEEGNSTTTVNRKERGIRKAWYEANFFKSSHFIHAYQEGWLPVKVRYEEGYAPASNEHKKYARVSLPFQTAPLEFFDVHPSFVKGTRSVDALPTLPQSDITVAKTIDSPLASPRASPRASPHASPPSPSPPRIEEDGEVTHRALHHPQQVREVAKMLERQNRIDATSKAVTESLEAELEGCEAEEAREDAIDHARGRHRELTQDQQQVLQQLVSMWLFEPDGLAQLNYLLGGELIRKKTASTFSSVVDAKTRRILLSAATPAESMHVPAEDDFDFSITTKSYFHPVPPEAGERRSSKMQKKAVAAAASQAPPRLPLIDAKKRTNSFGTVGRERGASLAGVAGVGGAGGVGGVAKIASVAKGNVRKGATFSRGVTKDVAVGGLSVDSVKR